MRQKAGFIDWIKVLRLRTLPLSVASMLMGIGLAYHYGARTPMVWLWALVTVLCLQILSNIANDYGDGVKGTDNHKRLGPVRGIQSGRISKKQMRKAMLLAAFMSLASGLLLLYVSPVETPIKLFFMLLGIVAIVAAIVYTVGKKAYGYYGFGDLFVLLFFGYLSVLGVLVLSGLPWLSGALLPATAVGAFSMAVLNLNNMRDIENDRASGKRTLAVALGAQKARVYHLLILLVGWLCMFCYSVGISDAGYIVEAIFALLFFRDMRSIFKEKEAKSLDKYLKRTSLFTLAFVICFWLSVNLLMR